ncbi:MAG: cell wall hydrolase [Desulfosporosinus sp.]|nr:cell wall hydrolase [Desulfosporosinus sp.]
MCLFLWQASIYPVLGQGSKNWAVLSSNIAKEETNNVNVSNVNPNALEKTTPGTIEIQCGQPEQTTEDPMKAQASWWVNVLRGISAVTAVYRQGLSASLASDPPRLQSEPKIQTYEIIVNKDTQFSDRSPQNTSSDTDDAQKPVAQKTVPIEPESQVLSRSLGRLVSKEDIELLSRVIYGEARGENFEGQVAVGAVVLNRLKDPRFPKTIRSIIYQSGAFTAVEDQQIHLDPDDVACKAAEAALSGVDPTNGAIFYFNPRIATDRWIKSRPVIKRIGNHTFSI